MSILISPEAIEAAAQAIYEGMDRGPDPVLGICGVTWTTHWPDEDKHLCRVDTSHSDHVCACGATHLIDPPAVAGVPAEAVEAAEDQPETIGQLADRLPFDVPTEAYGYVWTKPSVQREPDHA